MEKERDILFLTALVAAGATLASGLAASLQWMVVLPLTLGVLCSCSLQANFISVAIQLSRA